MKRAVIALVMALPLAVGVAGAQADSQVHWGDDQGTQSAGSVVAVAGTITSVDASTSTFTANAFVPTGEADNQGDQSQSGDDDQADGSQSSDDGQSNDTQNNGGQGDQGQGTFHNDWRSSQSGQSASTTPVTITTDGSTTFRVDGQDGTIADLSPGQHFVALFNGSPSDSLQTLVSSPALAVSAHTSDEQHQLYAFVGTVSAVDTSAGTVAVEVTNSLPSGLVSSASNPATFTVSPSTMVLGGSATNGLFGGSLSDVAVGDVVAGGVIGPAGETLSQVESSPLQVLVDFPASATPNATSSMRHLERRRALTQALALFGYKGAKRSTVKRHHGHHHATSHTKTLHRGSHSRTHAKRT
jgi:hypothetical protein